MKRCTTIHYERVSIKTSASQQHVSTSLTSFSLISTVLYLLGIWVFLGGGEAASNAAGIVRVHPLEVARVGRHLSRHRVVLVGIHVTSHPWPLGGGSLSSRPFIVEDT